ncbi:serine proteinase stubble [Melanaphis sacchari]|uniref:serine proteinase stubble n=1 Tax=Melanaphis sacchari TaxID=742174 RepID=UPI000DC130D1|nr:serine proteinase stubble [Melanaphis sacchari]XP_025198027.1 serine proteinase stubble [Melanaphis sacchari]
MKRHGICSAMKSSHNKALLLKISIIGLIISQSLVKSYPSWDSPTTITDFGRNIRQLPCVSRKSGETGVCMFAYSCAKANGTHLGTCIDRFYFGSCCKTQSVAEIDAAIEPDNYLNSVDNNEVAGPAGTIDTKTGAPLQQQTTSVTDRYSTPRPSSTNYPPSTAQSYKPTGQFAVSSTPSTTTSTSRTQYTEMSGPSGTKPTFASTMSSSPPTGSIASSYSTTISQSTKPMPSTTFSTAKPAVKPTSFKPPPIRDQATTATATAASVTAAATQKPKPQTARPTVQFSVPSSTAGYSHEPATKPATTTTGRPYTAVTSMRPHHNSTAATATFATTKPVVKPSSTTHKSTTASAGTPPTTAAPTQKVKPQTATRPVATTPKPRPATTGKPEPFGSSTAESATAASSYSTRTTVDNVTEIIANFTAAVTNGQSQTPSYGSMTTVTSTSPTLVTWTTLDKVPAVPAENTKPPSPSSSSPPPSMTHKPSVIDGSTHPSWVKLPVETHEPNTVGTPPKESSSSTYSSTMMMSKPTTQPSPSDNDIVMTSNVVDTTYSSTPSPSSSLSSMLTQSTSTESVEPGSAPLNMSNYKDVCGRRLFPTARIVGGEKVSFGKWPWQISLRQWRTSTYLHKCGAALFNENWAVTAAHCVENVPPSDLLLRLGEHDLSVEEEPYGYEERRIQIVASHPQFDPRTFEYDLALLRFYEPVKFQPNIIPVCVPEDDSNFVGSSAYVTGWGRLYEDGPLPSVLQEVTVPVINNSVCETMYRAAGYIEHIPDIFICAGWKKGGFDSCEGDSGGPMVIQRPDKRWLLAGIISWGIGCAEPNQPGVYTRISKFKDWINQILQF